MNDTVTHSRRDLLAGAGGALLLGALWPTSAVADHDDDDDDRDTLTIDVACLGGTFAPVLGSALANPDQGDFRGITFSVEGLIYPGGTIPAGAGFNPASKPVTGTWVCRGWFIFHPGRTEPHLISQQEYFLGGELSKAAPSTRHQLTSSGTEGGVPSTLRSVLGGTGRYRKARGEVVQDVTGTNTTVLNVVREQAPNFRFHFRLD